MVSCLGLERVSGGRGCELWGFACECVGGVGGRDVGYSLFVELLGCSEEDERGERGNVNVGRGGRVSGRVGVGTCSCEGKLGVSGER